jgi:hypothetical protein
VGLQNTRVNQTLQQRNIYIQAILIFLMVSAAIKAVLALDPFSATIVFMNFLVLLLYRERYEHSNQILLWWAIAYMMMGHGINAGAKFLVINSGNSWEISKLTLSHDLLVVVCGILLFYLVKKEAKINSEIKSN